LDGAHPSNPPLAQVLATPKSTSTSTTTSRTANSANTTPNQSSITRTGTPATTISSFYSIHANSHSTHTIIKSTFSSPEST